jgi:hypothetical protein
MIITLYRVIANDGGATTEDIEYFPSEEMAITEAKKMASLSDSIMEFNVQQVTTRDLPLLDICCKLAGGFTCFEIVKPITRFVRTIDIPD